MGRRGTSSRNKRILEMAKFNWKDQVLIISQIIYMDIMDIWMPCLKKSNIGKQFLILWCYMTPCRRAIYYQCPRGNGCGGKADVFPWEVLQNVAQNVCGDKGKKKGMALTISDNLCHPFVWDECNREVHSNRTEENQFFFRSPNS